jgi:methylmalonyl-CoA/ethylmalonyl-CoA epimerase
MTARAIHHVGVVVEDLDPVVETYERLLGGQLELRRTVEALGIEAAVIRFGDDRVELIAPLGDDSPLAGFLESRGPGLHHVAYEVGDVRGTLARLKEQGVELVDEEPRIGIFGHEIAFVHPDSVHGVLTEVVAGG